MSAVPRDIERKPTGTLAAWAYRQIGPSFRQVGRQALYRRSEAERWLEQQRPGGSAAEEP
jgi:hypothetical protein